MKTLLIVLTAALLAVVVFFALGGKTIKKIAMLLGVLCLALLLVAGFVAFS